ncbi:uncharacterized protein I303_105918 [Kwoniella dejecticola CBS 10117]|uniref:NAD-dependent epimerase/dehydratase domain-containing protein n=1 Tax=Kwoniella dejecticola CBS 10117 TaxID=1296121 RepID=A0A1A6A0U3_9TREE|nr:uncharacterized protein I303_05941 [Kwoniella dejecticola CBS 10117]OBR83661.1 hypothetical protein I303_05941 [Kwoniella dejecticola CBS 10117]
MTKSVLIFGASGLMMSHLLPHLQQQHDAKSEPNFTWTAYVRPGSRGIPFLTSIGVKIIEGSWEDKDKISSLVNQYDIVWDAGDSHDPSLPAIIVPALVEGPRNTAFARFSGTGNWITPTGGNLDESARLYDDSKEGDIRAIHGEMFNGAGDLIALDALEKGVNVWILCTGGVYGQRPAGISSSGVFVRLYTNNALQLGYTPYIGDGGAHMQLIHIKDLLSAFDLFWGQVLASIKSKEEAKAQVPKDVSERYLFAPGYSVSWKRIAETWSKVFKDNFQRDVPVKNVSAEEAGFISPLINSEMKSKPTRLEHMGWKLTGPTIEEELPLVLSSESQLPLA